VISVWGLIPNSAPTTNVALTVSSVSPSTGLNYLGGDSLTISGSNFGTDISKVSVTTTDTSICNVTSVSSSTIVCSKSAFSTVTTSAQNLNVVVNSVTDSSLTVTQVSSVPIPSNLSPSSVSPVLKTTIVMTLPSDYEGSITVSEFTVELLKDDADKTYVKDLYIMSADASAKTLTVKFGGAVSGAYRLRPVSLTYGRLDD